MLNEQFRYNPAFHIIYSCLLVFCCYLAWMLQSHLLVNWDVSWDLLVTKRLFAGGNYLHDFFDLNPPLIWYLLSPAIAIESLFKLSEANALYLYLYLLGSLSLSLCYPILKKIFQQNSIVVQLSIIIFALFFLLPQSDFGEREHFLAILSFPYFLLSAYRFAKRSVNPFFSSLVGLLAGFGFAIKPYFLLAPAFILLYNIKNLKKITALLSVENIVLVAFLIIYSFFVLIYFPDYLNFVVPLARVYYSLGFSDSWKLVVFTLPVVFCYFMLTYYIFSYQHNKYKPLLNILVIAQLAFLFSYFIQKTSWDYHIYPALAVSIFIAAILTLTQNLHTFKKRILMSVAAILIFSYPIFKIIGQFNQGIIYKNSIVTLQNFMQKHTAQKSVYFFSASPRDIFPVTSDTHAHYSSRLLHLFWIPGMLKLQQSNIKLKDDSPFFMNMVIEDLKTYQPEYVFIDTRSYKPFFSGIDFDYLVYFSKNQEFNTIWKHYHYVTTIQGPSTKIVQSNNTIDYSLYQFAVYQLEKNHESKYN